MGQRKDRQPSRPGKRSRPLNVNERQLELWRDSSANSLNDNNNSQTVERIVQLSAKTDKEPNQNQITTVTTPAKEKPESVPATPRFIPDSTKTYTALPAAISLTRRQHELLDYLKQRSASQLLPPSLGEICRDLGLVSRGSMHKQVSALIQAGLVEPMLGKQRGVRLVVAANDAEIGIPVLGAIAAGRPIEALPDRATLSVPAWMKTQPDCYALRVRGDSMNDAGILDGDLVVIAPRSVARNGDIVVALIDSSDATLKRVEQRPNEVLLHSANPAHPVQRYRPDQVQIQGVLVAQLRRY